MTNPESQDPLTAHLPIMQWLHANATEHGVPYLGSVLLELLRARPLETLRALDAVAVQALVPIVEYDLIPRSVIVEAFAAARAAQPAAVTASADEVLSIVSSQIEALRAELGSR